MRLALAAVALLVAAGPGWAGVGSVDVDKVFSRGSYIHVLTRYTNQGSKLVDTAVIDCSIFDVQHHAVGSAQTYPKTVSAGQSVVAELLASAPPDMNLNGISAECRVVSEF